MFTQPASTIKETHMKTIESLANFVNCPATDIHACGKVSVLVSVYGKGVVFNRFFCRPGIVYLGRKRHGKPFVRAV
jgi:hypothetical protein